MVGVAGQPVALLLVGVLDAVGRPELDDAESDAGVWFGVVTFPSQGDALQAHQAQRRVVPPLVRVAAPGIDQVAAREEQLLELLEAPVGDQDRSLAHGEVVLHGRADIRAWAWLH